MCKFCCSSSRFFRGNRAGHGDAVSFSQSDGNEKHGHGPAKKSGPLLSGIAYCLSSCSMILLNKIVLSGYNFNAGVSLMFYQVCQLLYHYLGSFSTRLNHVKCVLFRVLVFSTIIVTHTSSVYYL